MDGFAVRSSLDHSIEKDSPSAKWFEDGQTQSAGSKSPSVGRNFDVGNLATSPSRKSQLVSLFVESVASFFGFCEGPPSPYEPDLGLPIWSQSHPERENSSVAVNPSEIDKVLDNL